MTSSPHESAAIEFPTDLDILITREFEAPIALVFDVFTSPEHITKWFFDRDLHECSIDLRVGGDYRYVFVTDDGTEMVFRGTFLEVEPPTRLVSTWFFDGWPDAEAVESFDLLETDGTTTMTLTLAFTDQAGRAHMKDHDGFIASLDRVEALLRSLQA